MKKKKKKFSIKNMSVKAKIVLFSVMMIVFMVIIAGVGLFAATSINSARSARYDNYAMGEYYLSEATSDFGNLKTRVRNMPIMWFAPGVDIDFDDQVTKINNFEKNMLANFGEFETRLPNYTDPQIAAQYQVTRAKFDEWMTSIREDIELFQQGKNSPNAADYDEAKIQAGCDDLMLNGRQIADEAEAELDNLIALLEAESAANGASVNQELTVLIGVMIGVSVLAFVLTLALALFIIRLITVPVGRLTEAAQKLAVGDVEIECEKIADDDLGDLMDDFDAMVRAIKEQAHIAQDLASGDMTVSVTPRSEKDVLGYALKKLADDQNVTLGNVKESTMQVTVGSEQVAMASQSLAQGATEQASALEEVTVSVNDIAERTKLNASEANRANDLVHTVKEKALIGNNQMNALKEAMHDINKTSEDISKIIKVIDDIAFQTNILALNAAVEAARAGVHGKGFSVVAEEVRNLAGKSGSAASETAEMIENAIRTINNGTQLADETEKSLDAIVKQIDEIVELIVQIASSSNDQATAVSQIDQALGQVSQVVQTNSATSEECAAASEELSNQATNLRELMANFKLTNKGGATLGNSGDLGFSATGSFGASAGSDPVISLDGEFGKY